MAESPVSLIVAPDPGVPAERSGIGPSSLVGQTATLPTTTGAVTSAVTSAETSRAPGSVQAATTGLLLLSGLLVKPRGEKTGYSRDQFGLAWTDDVPVDDGGNGCSTREDVLRRDLSDIVMISPSEQCTVLSGTLDDRYTATAIPYLHGASSGIDIDHLVALSDAWQTGANFFTPELRQSLANDPLNLQAVSSQANRQKGDGDTATWLPPNRAYRCEYVRRQIDVKVKYGLWVKPAESEAMQRVLTGCGGVPAAAAVSGSLPVSAFSATTEPTTESPADSISFPTTVLPTAYPADGEDYFANCAAAKAAGRAPLLRGDPAYRSEMDGDDDGVACEVAH